MTWSIVARDKDGSFGIAVASRFFAVGALCPHGRGGVGALSTQALVNPLYGPRGIDLLAEGIAPDAVVRALTDADPGRDSRQLHMIDARGRTAAHTGRGCIDWCGYLAGDDWSIAGNMLAGPQVLDATAAAHAAHAALPLAQRLLAAMEAGEAAGGDKRGRQGAALKIYTTEEYPALDLRVDDHPDPLAELRRLYEVSLERFQPFVHCLPTRANPGGVTDRAQIEAAVEAFQRDRAAAAR